MEVQRPNDQPIGVEWIRSSVRRRVVVAAWALLVTATDEYVNDHEPEGASDAEP